MTITIVSLKERADGVEIEALIDGKRHIGHVDESREQHPQGLLRGLNIREKDLSFALLMRGPGRHFSADYWSYREQGTPPLPWMYEVPD